MLNRRLKTKIWLSRINNYSKNSLESILMSLLLLLISSLYSATILLLIETLIKVSSFLSLI